MKNYRVFIKWEDDKAIFSKTNWFGMIYYKLSGLIVLHKDVLDVNKIK